MGEEPKTAAAEPSASERLDSWKEIAAYLKRDARTVRRWEKSEGLPVHRHVHRKKPTVYAYRNELDAWWNNRRPKLELDAPAVEPAPRLRWKVVLGLSFLLAAVSLFVLTVPTGEVARESEDDRSVAVVQKVFQDDSLPGSCCVNSVSPDGRFLGYNDVDRVNIGAIDMMAMEDRRLTERGSLEEGLTAFSNPLFAPGSDRVVYTWERADARTYELRITELSGSTRRIYQSEDILSLPLAWSRDGRSIAVSREHRDGTLELVLVSAEDGTVRFVKSFARPLPTHMSFSPDGQHLAYAHPPDTATRTNDIFLLAVDGGAETGLTEHPGDDIFPVWLADGSGIFFLSDRTGSVDAWLLPMEGSEVAGSARLLQRELGRVLPIALTDEGDFYFKRQTGLVDVYVTEVDPLTGEISTPPEPIPSRFSGTNMMPSWSPDGRSVAFVSRRNWISSWVLVIHDLETGTERSFSEMRYVRQPRWAPGGETLLVRGVDRDGREGTFEIDPETGEILSYLLPGMGRFAVWSEDGGALVYQGNGRIYRRDLSRGNDEELFVIRPPSWFGNRITLSRDGRHLAFTRVDPATSSTALVVLSVEDGELRELVRVENPETMLLQDWSADGRFVLYRHSGPEDDSSKWSLFRVSVDNGETKRLLQAEGIRNVRVHPDGRRIAFTSGWPLVELFVMKNALSATLDES